MSSLSIQLDIWEKLALLVAVAKTCKGNGGGRTLKVHLSRLMARTLFGATSLRQQQFLLPISSSISIYEEFAKKQRLTPDKVELTGGAKGFWIGNKSLQHVFVFFVGGGYVLPLTPGHLEFCWQIKQTVRQHGPDIAILVVQYTLAPQTVYPEQVKQSVEAVRYVMSTLGKRSSDIILGGDSAGGTLALDVVIHAQHPHPSIAPLTPATPYRGLLLISPWVDFSINNESWKRNGDKDICTAAAFKTWSEAYLGSMPSDNYSEPCRATTEYFERVQARKILVTAGQEEVLVDAVTALANQIKASHSDTQLVVGHGECHVSPISRFNLGDTEKGEQSVAIDSWLATCWYN